MSAKKIIKKARRLLKEDIACNLEKHIMDGVDGEELHYDAADLCRWHDQAETARFFGIITRKEGPGKKEYRRMHDRLHNKMNEYAYDVTAHVEASGNPHHESSKPRTPLDAVESELMGALRYLEEYKQTGLQSRMQLAHEELKHAEMLAAEMTDMTLKQKAMQRITEVKAKLG